LQIHRIISESIDGTLDENRIRKYKKILDEVAKNCSINERRAEDAERETDKCKIVQFMSGKVGEEFDGIISGATSWGIYVELENTVEGMVNVKDMDDDYYIYKDEDMCWFGERTHKTYTVGDRVRVKLVKADIEARTIDFEFVTETD
jgi:ribonuclease R